MRTVEYALVFVALAGALSLTAGCSDDFGTPCDFPSSPEIAEFCDPVDDPDGNDETATCIDPLNADCESRLCVRFQGSSAFCSERCSTNGGCPGSATCEFALGQSIGVCVPRRFTE